MNGISKHRTLTQAKDDFSKANFKTAMEKFAIVLQDFPNSKEAFNGVILSEMAMSGEGGAEALFDYYEILKDEDREQADIIMSDILKNMDGSLNKLGEMFSTPIRDRIEYEDGILYQDFKKIVANGEGFKKTFENIMFSTRVIITNRDDFLDFLDTLIEHDFAQMALSYLENAISLYPSDELLTKLLENLNKKKNN